MSLEPYALRLGTIRNVDYTKMIATIVFHDVVGSERTRVPLSQPYVGRGWGIYAGIEAGSLVIVGFQQQELPTIVAFVHNPAFFDAFIDDFVGRTIRYDEYPFRRIESGEIVMQSKANSVVMLTKDGDIIIENVAGDSIVIDKQANAIVQKSAQRYTTSEAGLSTIGIVKRKLKNEKGSEEDPILSYASNWGEDYDVGKTIIGGQKPTEDFNPDTNKALTEHRLEVHEFADSNVAIDDLQSGQQSIDNILATLLLGTLVDTEGNILDLDGNPITSEQDLKKAVMCSIIFQSGWKFEVSKEGETRINFPKSDKDISINLSADGKVNITAATLNIISNDIHLGSKDGGDPIIRNTDFPTHIDPITGAPITSFRYEGKSKKVSAD